jgi:hypothetical protein
MATVTVMKKSTTNNKIAVASKDDDVKIISNADQSAVAMSSEVRDALKLVNGLLEAGQGEDVVVSVLKSSRKSILDFVSFTSEISVLNSQVLQYEVASNSEAEKVLNNFSGEGIIFDLIKNAKTVDQIYHIKLLGESLVHLAEVKLRRVEHSKAIEFVYKWAKMETKDDGKTWNATTPRDEEQKKDEEKVISEPSPKKQKSSNWLPSLSDIGLGNIFAKQS